MQQKRYEDRVPLYYQISTILKERILSGELASGVLLPGEEALSREYGVSRITVRHALTELETEGLIVRKRGQGTYVSERSANVRPTRFDGSIEALIAQATSTSVQILSFLTIVPPEDVAEKLDLKNDDKAIKIEKVRFINDAPLSIIVNILPHDIGKKIKPEDLSSDPLLVVLENKLGIKAYEAVQSIEATIADSEKASLLDVRIGAPLLKVKRTVYNEEGSPLEFVTALYRADKYFYTVRLKRNFSNGSAGWNLHV